MRLLMKPSQKGISHVLLVLIVVICLAVVGGIVWYALRARGSSILPAKYTLNDKCEYNDPELCKFINNFPNIKSYSFNGVITNPDGSKGETTFIIDGDEKSQSITSTNGQEQYNVITIGNTTYSKDYSDNSWYKQTFEATTTEETSDAAFDITPTNEQGAQVKVTYTSEGKEKCGDLNCFKYKMTTEGDSTITYIWFDDRDYLMRKTTTQNPDGASSEFTFSYDKTSISEPSPVKETPPAAQNLDTAIPPQSTTTDDASLGTEVPPVDFVYPDPEE